MCHDILEKLYTNKIEYSEMDDSNNRFMRKQENTNSLRDTIFNQTETSDEEVFTIVEDGSMLERLILEDFESEVISALFKVISSLFSSSFAFLCKSAKWIPLIV